MRNAYASALGDFLVAFNALENAVRKTVRILLEQQQGLALWPSLGDDMFARQVVNLQLLALSMPDLPEIPYDRITALNAKRNLLAHGHFDQDLFGEAYKVVGRKKAADVSIADMQSAKEEATELLHEVESLWPYLWFDDLDAEAAGSSSTREA